MQTFNANLENMLETNSLTISIVEELAMLGFDYKQLKRLNALLLQISKAHGLTTSHGLAVEKFFTEIEEDYDDVQGFRSTIEKLRKDSRELALRLRTERSIFEALPHLNDALGSLLRRGVYEDQIVKISELLESCPNFIELYVKPSDSSINPEVPFATASTASLTGTTASTSPSTVRMATKNIQDGAPSYVDNAQLNSFTRAEYIRSETGTVQKEIDKKNSGEAGLMTSSQHIVSKMRGIRRESRRMPGNESLARLSSAVVSYDELAIFGVTSSGHSAGHPPSSVTDINSSTSWIGQQSGGWLQLDLGSRKNIHRINIAWSPHSLGRINFALSVSEDGISFNEKKVGSSENAYPTCEMYHLPQNTYGRYIRITIQETTGDDRFGISGIVLYSPHSQQT
ncbi:MAG: discoidin domain-containing protein, partial [Nitrososphaeraceae archaeon]